MRDWLHRTLVEMVPRDHRQSAARPAPPPDRHLRVRGHRRRGARVLAEHRARQRAVLPRHRSVSRRCGRSARSPPDPCTSAGSCTRPGPRRPVLTPILLGLAPGRGLRRRRARWCVRCACARGAGDHGPRPRRPGRRRCVLVLITALNGVAEELFFRGAAYAATTRYPVPVTTVAYTAVTLATGNVMLAFAAVILGAVVGLAAPGVRRDPGADPHPRHLVADDAARPARDLLALRSNVRPSSSSARRTASS